eukprot:114977-Prymnesium_polylepis.1
MLGCLLGGSVAEHGRGLADHDGRGGRQSSGGRIKAGELEALERRDRTGLPAWDPDRCPLQVCRAAFANLAAERDPNAGHIGLISAGTIFHNAIHKRTFNVIGDLTSFTGLSRAEVVHRMRRVGRFHVRAEMEFWGPESVRELTWYYRTSVNYLFYLAWHSVEAYVSNRKWRAADGPILELAPGVGNNGIHLAQLGVPYVYAGISLIEAAFFEYRIHVVRSNISKHVTIVKPYSAATGALDPLTFFEDSAAYHGKLGGILAFDVLEHIPRFERTVAAMVRTLRPGGFIVEQSPFNRGNVSDPLHVSAGGVSMHEAMGPSMVLASVSRRGGPNVWRKSE